MGDIDPIVATVSVVVPAGAPPGTQLLVRVPASALRGSGAESDLRLCIQPVSPDVGSAGWSRWLVLFLLLLPVLMALVVERGWLSVLRLALPPVSLHLQHSLTPGWRQCLSPLTIVEKNPDEDWRAEYLMTSRIFSASTPYQDVAVYESEKLGRVLTLDGVLQVR
eukprot:COSAG02_NODE_2886_length_7814_cov_3.379123_4_plen_165_part_00